MRTWPLPAWIGATDLRLSIHRAQDEPDEPDDYDEDEDDDEDDEDDEEDGDDDEEVWQVTFS